MLAAPLIDWTTIGRIALTALIAGGGIVVLFGTLLLADKRANSSNSAGRRLAARAIESICALICVGVVVIGVYAMAEKPSSKPATVKSAGAAPANSVRYR